MELCLRKFAAHYAELFGESDYKFIEKHGRMLNDVLSRGGVVLS